mmetsp:Transcript_41894/g.110516  ORF Transcript_41894/g.110516 Transcript_41894/m.110516 type:complete len:368 (-) Transcript_41894:86-1189(-)
MMFICVAVAMPAASIFAVIAKRRESAQPTKLEQRHASFKKRLLASNPTAGPSDRGPSRAVTVGKLLDLFEGFQDFIQARTAYYLVPNVIVPLTKSGRISYAELAGPSSLDYFISHFWGTSFAHFVETVQKHAECAGSEDWRSLAYWICFISNNQWRVEEEVGNGDWRKSSFYLALQDKGCKATCMVLDPQAEPLRRSWCLFEVLQTYLLLQDPSAPEFEGLIFCTSSGVLDGQRDGVYDVSVALARRLAGLSVAEATATNKDDQQMIVDLIEEEGGIESMNHFIKTNMLETLKKMQVCFNGSIVALCDELDRTTAAPPAQHAALHPTDSEHVVIDVDLADRGELPTLLTQASWRSGLSKDSDTWFHM